MARYTGPKNKLMRRAGADLGLKTKAMKVSRRLNIPPGQHGRKGAKKLSDYGVQLREKQKVKWIYGVLEKQFRRYFDKATKNPADTGAELLKLLEQRLDNVIYRLGFSPTRTAARQLVVHGHVLVNEAKVDRPSYQIQVGDTVRLTAKALKIPMIAELLAAEPKGIPSWLNRKGAVGQIKTLPNRDHIDADVNEQLIVEYFSR